MSMIEVHPRWKNKNSIKGTQIQLIEFPVQIEWNISFLTSGTIRDIHMQSPQKFKTEVTISAVPNL